MSSLFHRTHPFSAKIKDRFALTKPGSTKSTYHLSLDITGSGLTYKVGDSFGIYATNDPTLVNRLIQALKADPETPITHPKTGHVYSLKEYLSSQANLARVTTLLLKHFQNHPDVASILEEASQLQQTLTSFDVLDIVSKFGNCHYDLHAAVCSLAPLLPRFYSVASSQSLYPNEVHLLVTLTSFEHAGEIRYGVASHFLCDRAERETPILCYVQPTPHFTLPTDKEAPIIMVGPGTGVAPFRAFLQEREAQKSSGKNWLFFGERNRATDFYYEDFWNSLIQQNKLQLEVAFSRDQKEKVYVQHKLLEKGKELWTLLQEGAHFYVCGDADPMAKEVEAAMLQIFSTHGGLSPEDARAYLKKLRHDKRYLADVY